MLKVTLDPTKETLGETAANKEERKMFIIRFIKCSTIVEEIDVPRIKTIEQALAAAKKLVCENEEIEIVYYNA